MIAKLENDILNVYNKENKWIGGIKTQSDFKNAEIKIGKNNFQLSQNNRSIEISEKGNVLYNLKMNSFSGNTEILETGHRITGVFGFRWGTKMIDNDRNTLAKIRHKNQIIKTNIYEIEISNEKITALDILITLYAHVVGSNMKLKAVIIGTISVTIGMLSSGIMN